MGRRLLLVLGSSISGPARLARYTGTKGNTQGVAKDRRPAPKAAQSDKSSTIYIISYPNAN